MNNVSPHGRRRAGVLLHPTSLPGPADSGVLGADAFRFVDFLKAAGFTVWQTLPVGPVGGSLSPYQMTSAFAGNARLIDPSLLVRQGWLKSPGTEGCQEWPARAELLAGAWAGFRSVASHGERQDFGTYWQRHRQWLLPYTLFRLCRDEYGDGGWWTWPTAIRRREPGPVARLLERHRDRLRGIAFEQYLFDRQWNGVRKYAEARGISLFGDIPIYVDLDSADVWWHRHLFRVDDDGRPAMVAGVPPDYFSADGQVWGNPLYDWPRLLRDGFHWWIARIRTQLERFDLLRIDHFRGLQAYWEIPAGDVTARNGHWREAPGAELLGSLRAAIGALPLVAEDLGTITPAVHSLREQFDLPGMLILQFAFDGSLDNPYLPARHRERAVVYTGSHDNDTLAGWYAGLDARTLAYASHVLGCRVAELPGAVLQAVWHSPAGLAMVPFQDLLGLGTEARMNTPGTISGNWTWRFEWSQVDAGLAQKCRRDLGDAGRFAADVPASVDLKSA